MTIYERLFGTPERAAWTLSCLEVTDDAVMMCYLMDAIDHKHERKIKCANCTFEYNDETHECEMRPKTTKEWLATEVVE
jgi:ADP-ribosylglycohydrolase